MVTSRVERARDPRRIPIHAHTNFNDGGKLTGSAVSGPTGGGGGSSGGSSTHPNLGEHDAMGLSTDAELAAHAATPHGGTITVGEDGGTPVTDVDTVLFDGATVTDDTGGQVTVTITGGTALSDATPIVESGAGSAGTGTEASRDDHVHPADAGGGGGASYGQVVPYPTSFTGDVIDGSSTTPFVDVSAFDTKEVLNSRILHLQTLGASKDQRVRVTLGTTKAAAFDVRIVLSVNENWYGAQNDTYTDFRLSTAADGQLAIGRILSYGATGFADRNLTLTVGGATVAASGANFQPTITLGTDITLRITRDGSDVIRFYYGQSQAPMALVQVFQRTGTYAIPYTQTVSGTLARLEIATHSPAGPNAAQPIDVYVDYVASV